MIVMAIDPGIVSGLAWKINGEYRVAVATNPTTVWEFIALAGTRPDLVLVEQFAATHIARFGLRTVELVGATEALCWANKIECVRRTPQHMIPGVANAVRWLTANNKDVKTMEHHKDALAHIMAYERLKGEFN